MLSKVAQKDGLKMEIDSSQCQKVIEFYLLERCTHQDNYTERDYEVRS